MGLTLVLTESEKKRKPCSLDFVLCIGELRVRSRAGVHRVKRHEKAGWNLILDTLEGRKLVSESCQVVENSLESTLLEYMRQYNSNKCP